MSDAEKFFIGLSIVEGVLLIYLLVQKYFSNDAVLLQPGKDKLRVDYWWIDEKDIDTEHPENSLRNLRKTTTEKGEKYIYDVEGTKILVSKEKSNDVSARIGAIKPPPRMPPPLVSANEVLVAIEITVVD